MMTASEARKDMPSNTYEEELAEIFDRIRNASSQGRASLQFKERLVTYPYGKNTGYNPQLTRVGLAVAHTLVDLGFQVESDSADGIYRVYWDVP